MMVLQGSGMAASGIAVVGRIGWVAAAHTYTQHLPWERKGRNVMGFWLWIYMMIKYLIEYFSLNYWSALHISTRDFMVTKNRCNITIHSN